ERAEMALHAVELGGEVADVSALDLFGRDLAGLERAPHALAHQGGEVLVLLRPVAREVGLIAAQHVDFRAQSHDVTPEFVADRPPLGRPDRRPRDPDPRRYSATKKRPTLMRAWWKKRSGLPVRAASASAAGTASPDSSIIRTMPAAPMASTSTEGG